MPSHSGPNRRRGGRLWSALLAVLVAWAAPAVAQRVPRLVVEAPPSLAAVAATVRSFDPEGLAGAMRLTGLTDPGPPIHVYLAPEGSPAAHAVASWVAGYALGARGRVVLLPARAPVYPDHSLESVLHHEVTHVLVARAARGHPVPRWFNEGVAMAAGRAWGIGDSSRFIFERLRTGRVSFAGLDRRFAGGAGEAATAYAVAGAFVHDLLRRYGPGVTGDILRRVGRGVPFDQAFREVTGSPLALAEAAFWQRTPAWSRWLPFLTSSFAIWLAITFLVLVAVRRRHAKTAEMHRRWEEEDAAAWRSYRPPRALRVTVPPDEEDEEIVEEDDEGSGPLVN